MAGFLDKNSRIIDMILTNHGRENLAAGKLDFSYWVPFDDEVDYSPFISNSGSLSEDQLSAAVIEQIEAQPIREATSGYRQGNLTVSDTTNVDAPLFSMPQGQHQLPRMVDANGVTGSLKIEVKQRRVKQYQTKRDGDGNTFEKTGPIDEGVERFDPSTFTLQPKYVDGSWPAGYQPDGFLVRIFESGSSTGVLELDERLDSNNDISYNNDLIVKIQGETITLNLKGVK